MVNVYLEWDRLLYYNWYIIHFLSNNHLKQSEGGNHQVVILTCTGLIMVYNWWN